jgi:hypothetical protein
VLSDDPANHLQLGATLNDWSLTFDFHDSTHEQDVCPIDVNNANVIFYVRNVNIVDKTGAIKQALYNGEAKLPGNRDSLTATSGNSINTGGQNGYNLPDGTKSVTITIAEDPTTAVTPNPTAGQSHRLTQEPFPGASQIRARTDLRFWPFLVYGPGSPGRREASRRHRHKSFACAASEQHTGRRINEVLDRGGVCRFLVERAGVGGGQTIDCLPVFQRSDHSLDCIGPGETTPRAGRHPPLEDEEDHRCTSILLGPV